MTNEEKEVERAHAFGLKLMDLCTASGYEIGDVRLPAVMGTVLGTLAAMQPFPNMWLSVLLKSTDQSCSYVTGAIQTPPDATPDA